MAAAAILKENKLFIAEEIISYIDTNVADILYDKVQFGDDLFALVTGITYDIVFGTNFKNIYHSTGNS